ncbi:MAG: hypothetical protein A3G25_03530 [Betaproteobacteria bacterium RIFCSPLOWO2_12_FULL_63_13]|jgi:DUF971 family protein|nr:MAG: hypothetical protein A3G25_03530 [Betaproteobacteria bacterium RIFCSPLOWO2_12_FULL_63_13]
MTSAVQPLEICNHGAAGMLEIAWSDGMTGIMAHRLLREACRCAYCTAAARGGVPVLAKTGIRITAVEPYGNNTLRLGFNDGHQRGLYPFDYLRSLAAPVLPVPGR